MKRDIEKEIELETKDYKHLIDTLLSKINNNIENGNSEELKCACEMLEKAADAKLDCIKGVYHIVLMDAMLDPDNQYGENWDEEGPMKKGYRPNMRRGYDGVTWMNDDMPDNMNRMMYGGNNMNRMYDNTMNRNNSDSQYDRAKRGYKETKDINSLTRLFDIIEEDVRELKPNMSSSDKQTAHQRLTSLANMINV